MRIPPALIRVQQRVSELHALSGATSLRSGAAGFQETLTAKMAGRSGTTTGPGAAAPTSSAGASVAASATTTFMPMAARLPGSVPPATAAAVAVGRPGPVAAVGHPSRSYANGRIPAAAMDTIGRGHHRLWGPAAASFRQLLADAERAGVDIGVTDSYRSYEGQVDVARRKGLYSQGGLAAKPGTSQHGWGLAVDLDLDATAQRWMRANAGRYGFVEDTPREPWHWAYKGISAD